MDAPDSYAAAIGRLTRRYPQWPPAAYDFLRRAMKLAAEVFAADREEKHLSAEELYLACCMNAHNEYGPMAGLVLETWGVKTSSDIGALVYNLIAEGVFSRQKKDRKEDFDGLPDLGELLSAPYVLSDEGAGDPSDAFPKEPSSRGRRIPPFGRMNSCNKR